MQQTLSISFYRFDTVDHVMLDSTIFVIWVCTELVFKLLDHDKVFTIIRLQ